MVYDGQAILATSGDVREGQFPGDYGHRCGVWGADGNWDIPRGLWSETLLCDLMWRRSPNGQIPQSAYESYIALSWSWASRDRAVYYQHR